MKKLARRLARSTILGPHTSNWKWSLNAKARPKKSSRSTGRKKQRARNRLHWTNDPKPT